MEFIPKHPIIDKISRVECQQIIDINSVETIQKIMERTERKRRDMASDISKTTDLEINNAVLKVKDEMSERCRIIEERVKRDMATLISEHVTMLKSEIDRNTVDIKELKACGGNSGCTHNAEQIETISKRLATLTANVQRLYDEYNK